MKSVMTGGVADSADPDPDPRVPAMSSYKKT